MYATQLSVLRGVVRCRALANAGKQHQTRFFVAMTDDRRYAATAAGDHPPSHATFRSTTKFKLAPAQVNETNVPSAKEVGQMIPTLRELQEQLPDARALEQRYIRPETVLSPALKSEKAVDAADSKDVDGAHYAVPPSITFQKTTDPIEDLLFGPPVEEGVAAGSTAEDHQRPKQRHLLLAYRALLWGTVYALLGFGSTVGAAMYLCGFRSLGALLDGVRGKMSRDEDRLRAAVGSDAVEMPVEHFVIDLTHPTEAWRQLQEVWSAVQRLAEEEEAKAERSATL